MHSHSSEGAPQKLDGRALIVDDDPDMRDLIAAILARRGCGTVGADNADEALAKLGREEFEVVLADLRLRGMDGIALCERIAASRPDVPVIVITAYGSFDAAVGALRAGAWDFVTKPFEEELLVATVARALRHRRLGEEVRRLRIVAEESRRFEELLGSSPPMAELFDLLDRVTDSEATVLLTGESGTGKELVARSLHARSRRRDGPFVAFNCAAVPESLLESELFGHARGAFTDARTDRDGLFVQANGGTLFLDEVGDTSLGLQAKLLRALEARRVRRVGGGDEIPFDARLVAATNRDLELAVEEHRFREDLYFRLNVIHVAVPPLRARGTDVLLLAQDFVRTFAAREDKQVKGISEGVAEKLLGYDWPGNVRELRNSMERAVALSRYVEVVVDDLPERIRDYRASHMVLSTDDPATLVPLEEVERRYITRVMQAVGGNKSVAARILGVDRKTLYRRLARRGQPGSPEGLA